MWIYDHWEFKQYPVIKIDFSGKKIDKPQDLEDYISRLLLSIADDYQVAIDKDISYEEQFFFLIKELAKKERIVILIDEYDKPIVDYITSPKKAAENREVLRAFYTVIKKADEYLRFIFLTGVSKFSKTSLFSGLNNLRDLTVEDQYSSMLGYTQSELEENFSDYLKSLGEKESLEKETLLQNIQGWYNGYSWDTRKRVYNPHSILSLFLKGQFDNYWFATGTPTFLVSLIREKEFNLPELENLIVGSELLDSFDVEQMVLEAILFQTGYLTIKEIVRDGVRLYYKLDYPNYEVKESLLNHLLASYTDKPAGLADIHFLYMRKDLEKGDIASFFEKLQGIISGIPNNLVVEKEAYYSSLIYTILALVGIRAEFVR